jgi:outer membrane receptor protein involved in Fe transport
MLVAAGLLAAARAAAQAPQAMPTPAQLEPVVVGATRTEQRLKDAPASVTVLTQEDIATSPARTADDLLRQVPGFSLFRRSSSAVANPTTQGVSLRGIGPSGVSRTLVLVDGIPQNDPFGGWIYWSRIPLEDIERIEVVRGGGSHLYGSAAMGGVINVVTRRPDPLAVEGRASGGNRATVSGDLAVSHVLGPVGFRLRAEAFDTHGYPIVAAGQRGAIDRRADSTHAQFQGKVEYTLAPEARLSLAGSFFTEDRNNGTPFQVNSTDSGSASGLARFKTPDGSAWEASLFGRLQTFEQTFSAIAGNRNSETPTVRQRVPVDYYGGSLQWTRRFLRDHLLTAGLDARLIDGQTDEELLTGANDRRDAGGTQGLWGIYLQDQWTPHPRWQVTAGLRYDSWRNYDGFRNQRARATGLVTHTDFRDRVDTALSPKLSLLYRPLEPLALRASFYRAFRAPTLNELYRRFRVGNVETLANPDLGPERMTGGEAGADLALARGLTGRVTGFWNEVKDPISNRTFTPPDPCPEGIPPGSVCRQRQNLGRTRIRGLEAEVEYVLGEAWTLRAAYLFDDAVVRSFPADRRLEGNRIAQVPRHQATFAVRYANPKLLTLTVQARVIGDQFEDDLNSAKLGDYVVVDVHASRAVGRWGEVFLGIENLFDRTFAVGLDPSTRVVTVGAPFLVHTGLRFRF